MRRFSALSLVLLLAPAAQAATLDLPGVYGSETGCKVLAGAPYTTDDKIILRPDSLEAHESLCTFLDVSPAPQGASVVRSVCEGEGTMWLRDFIVSAPDAASKARQILNGDGGYWTEVMPCD